ncbi:MAG TPA: PAS domain S-box protein [Terriglobales bacterium]|nr:PAS domain S-box protein [Terriglobales bacterium]
MQLPLPDNEVSRLENLRRYRILDTPPEQAFDDLTRLTAYVCGAPIALIGFMDLDRQWFKSRIGWDVSEVPREMSFCAHTILQREVLIVSDTLEDHRRLETCPLATHGGVRFYAGAPLMSNEGYALGTLCVMDSIPRGLTEGQTEALRKLARQVMTQLESRRLVSRALQENPGEISKGTSAEGALRESVAFYRTVTENASDAIIVIDEESKILFVNRATERIFGYAKDEMLGQPLTMLMPDYLRQVHRHALKKYLETGKRHISWEGVEVPGLHKSGKEIFLEISFGEDASDGKRIFAGICRNITGRNRAEHERHLAAIVESSGDAIISRDLDGIITSWNQAAEGIFGYAAQEAIGQPVSILAPPERSGEIPRITEKLKRGERVDHYETVRVAKNGQYLQISLSVSPIRDEQGNMVGASAIERDITERKQAQEALRQSEERLQGIISSAMDAIITVDSSQRVVVFNKAAEQIFRCAAAAAVGQPIEKFIPQRFRENHRQHIDGFARTGETRRSIYSPATLFALRADGEEFPIEATISQVETGGERFFTVILRDISARVRLEAELRQAQKIEAIGQLAGGVAHEFNNFLGVILGYSELLSAEAGDNERVRRSLAEINTATQHAAALTRHLLAFSRKQLVEPQVLDLNQAIWEAHKLIRRLVPANIDVAPVLAPTLGWVKIDPGQVQQVLINLMVNARDALPEGGKVVIETSDVELDEAYVSQHLGLQPGPYVMLSVSDTGCGMDAETLTHIFEPFFTTKQPGKGTGLGLSTIYGIVKQNAGHIAVESVVGRGSSFRIYLPRVQAPGEETRGTAPRRLEQTGRATVLVVEDEAALRRLLCLSLERRGYKVLTAVDGADAIEIFGQHPGEIDLVVSDLMMPRVDGFELKRRIAALSPAMRFLFMSGYSEEVVEQRQRALQGCAFLEKPFLPDDLANKVRDVLRGEVAA